MKRPVVEAFLHNIRSVYNVGSMFRTADAAGVAHLYLAGYTATPRHKKLAKTALGAELSVPWTQMSNDLAGLATLQARRCHLWALELAPGATPLFEVALPTDDRPVVLVVGNEVEGLSPTVLDQCDKALSIPMHGAKESLNVAVAFGVAVYHLCHVAAIKSLEQTRT